MAATVEEMVAQGKRFEQARKEGRVVDYSGYSVIMENPPPPPSQTVPEPAWRQTFVLRLKRDCLTGKSIRGLVMVRKTANGLEYRSLTASEQSDYVSAEAW